MFRGVILTWTIVSMSSLQTKAQSGSPSDPSKTPVVSPRSLAAALNIFNSMGKTGVEVVKTPILGLNEAARKALEAYQHTKSTLLQGAMEAFQKTVDATANEVGAIPGLGPYTGTVQNSLNNAAELANLAGQTLIAGQNSLINQTSGAIKEGTEFTADMSKKALDALLLKIDPNTRDQIFNGMNNPGQMDELAEWAQLMQELAVIKANNDQLQYNYGRG